MVVWVTASLRAPKYTCACERPHRREYFIECKREILDAMRSMLVEFERNHGRSESGRAEGSAAEGESPATERLTAVGQSPAGVGPAAVREAIFS